MQSDKIDNDPDLALMIAITLSDASFQFSWKFPGWKFANREV